MENLKESFGQRLKSLRKNKKYTQEVFAEMIDLSPRQLIRIENGENFPSSDVIEKISFVLDLDYGELFKFDVKGDKICTPKNTNDKLAVRVVKKNDIFLLKPSLKSQSEGLLPNSFSSKNEIEAYIADFCKKNSKTIVVDFFDQKQKNSVKIFSKDNIVDEVFPEDEIVKHELYDYVLSKVNRLYNDVNKMNYVKKTLDLLEDKNYLESIKDLVETYNLIVK